MNYKIVYGDSPNEINSKISEMIYDGWEPLGSHQVVVRREQNRYSGQQHMDTINQLEYTQTMVKKVKTTIEVDISFYHPNDNEDEKVYDEEGMREEFEYKLDCLIKNAGL
jgi:hypothetical protein